MITSVDLDVIVVHIDSNYGCIGQVDMPSRKEHHHLLKIDKYLLNNMKLTMFETLKVKQIKKMDSFDGYCNWSVNAFERHERAYGKVPASIQCGNRVLCIAQIDDCPASMVIYCVGFGVPTATPMQVPSELLHEFSSQNDSSAKLRIHDFIHCTMAPLPNGFCCTMIDGRVLYLLEDGITARTNGQLFPVSMRKLTSEEFRHIQTHTREILNLPEEQANLYIRDPWLACARLEEDINRQNALRHTVKKRISSHMVEDEINGKKRKRVMIEICLTSEETHRLLDDGDGSDTHLKWKVGTELQLSNSITKLMKAKSNSVAIEIHSIQPTKGNYTKVVFNGTATKQSQEFFDIILKSKTRIDQELCRIGPQATIIYSLAEPIEKGFQAFYRGRLFEEWRGSSSDSIKKRTVFNPVQSAKAVTMGESQVVALHSARDVALDESQLEALDSAAGTTGFTLVSAPPGSGKTLLISAIVAARNAPHNTRVSFGITAATNTSTTAAYEATSRNRPDLRVCREFSKRAKFECGKLSLRDMANDPYMYIDRKSLNIFSLKKLDAALAAKRRCENDLKKSSDLDRGMACLEKYRDAERKLRNLFTKEYAPHALFSSPVLLSRRAYPFTHLIIDEAARISPIEALAIYCKHSQLTHVTLLGDVKQLGPVSELPVLPPYSDERQRHTFKMITTGELQRMLEFSSQFKVASFDRANAPCCKLTYMYRYPKKHIDNWLIQIYGDTLLHNRGSIKTELTSGPNEMTLTAKDGSPCLLINLLSGENSTDPSDAVSMLCKELVKRRKQEEYQMATNDSSRLNMMRRLMIGTSETSLRGPHRENQRRLAKHYGQKAPFTKSRRSNLHELEVDYAIYLIDRLKDIGIKGEDVAVICHHATTKELLLIRLRGKGDVGGHRLPVDVSTVGAYQGKCARAVIVLTSCTVRRNISDNCSMENTDKQLRTVSNQRLECVALTRSLAYTFIIGDWQCLLKTSFWSQYRNTIKAAGALVDPCFNYIQPAWL